MAHYYTIESLLNRIEQCDVRSMSERATGPLRLNVLVPVTKKPSTVGTREDVFQLSSHPKLLDLTRPDSAQEFAGLLNSVPAYARNLELLLDHILTDRHNVPLLDKALRKAFGKDPVPEMQPQATGDAYAALRHPGLSSINTARLCEIYIVFLNAISPFYKRDFSFETDILGHQTAPFLNYFEGFIAPHGGQIRASVLLAFGVRLDHDPGTPLENYISVGQKKAAKMRITDPQEMIWAWFEADNHQMRHCRDLDRALKLEGLPRRPNWVRFDIFSLLEKEAIKQHLAGLYLKADPEHRALEGKPLLRKAILANADGRVDETLQQLLSQTLNADNFYAGAAARFADSAGLRERENTHRA